MRKNNLVVRRNVRTNKQALVESIMAKVAPIVKKAINESDMSEEYVFYPYAKVSLEKIKVRAENYRDAVAEAKRQAEEMISQMSGEIGEVVSGKIMDAKTEQEFDCW